MSPSCAGVAASRPVDGSLRRCRLVSAGSARDPHPASSCCEGYVVKNWATCVAPNTPPATQSHLSLTRARREPPNLVRQAAVHVWRVQPPGVARRRPTPTARGSGSRRAAVCGRGLQRRWQPVRSRSDGQWRGGGAALHADARGAGCGRRQDAKPRRQQPAEKPALSCVAAVLIKAQRSA